VDGVMKNLVEKNLVRISGRKKVPGNPYVYGTTRHFLKYFRLKSLKDLPRIEEFSAMAEQKELLDVTLEEEKIAEEENEPKSVA
ncbi:MAG TPA: SMC-Scp complex subunit ScpB, partial [Candidatus Omnitrophota bacterium]|nr:SMC-Scp complex subunit ScpB [Candidatus Omnitrophota bacterium]